MTAAAARPAVVAAVARRVPAVVLPRAAPLHTAAVHRSADIVVVMPQVAESIREGEVSSFEKKVGDAVKQDEPVLVLDTDKTSVPVNAPANGVVQEFFVNVGDTVAVGAKLFRITPGAAPAAAAAAAPAAAAAAAAAPKPAAAAAPAAAPKPAAAPAPVAAAAPKPAPVAAAPAAVAAAAPAAAAAAAGGDGPGVTRVRMKPIRRKTAERLKDSQNTAAMLTTFNEIDMSALKAFREKYKDWALKEHNVRLGYMSAFAKAVCYAAKDQPAVNAFIDGQDIVYHDHVNISVAVASPKGLVVPVLRDVGAMSFLDVERNLAALSTKARNNELAIEDMDGGTFTISNGGVFGSLMGTPILNPPQSGILGMHGIFDRPVAVNGQVVIRPMMYVALTYDHRLIDGREAVTFLRKVKEAVEDPTALLL